MTDPNPTVEAVARVLVYNYPVAGTALVAMQWWAVEVARDVVAALELTEERGGGKEIIYDPQSVRLVSPWREEQP